jgi:hypothetical protein
MKVLKAALFGSLFLLSLAANAQHFAVIVASYPVYENHLKTEQRCYLHTKQDGKIQRTPTGVGINTSIKERIISTPDYIERCVTETIMHPTLIGYDVRYVFDNVEYMKRLDYAPAVGSYLEMNVTLGR